jgi:hypothetical protein
MEGLAQAADGARMKKKTIIPVFVERAPLCPSCGGKLTVTFGDAMPEPDDFNVCGHCCAVLRFKDEAFNSRLVTAAELEEAVDKGDLDPKDATFLRGAQAEHVRRQGTKAN